MSQKKNFLLGAAVAGLTMVTVNVATADEVKCWGANKCGGKSKEKPNAACAVKKEDIEALKGTKHEKKLKNSKVHACGAHATCGAEHGQLNWFKTSKEECKKLGGFLIEGGKVKELS